MKIFQSILWIWLLCVTFNSLGQEKRAYRLFDAEGKEVEGLTVCLMPRVRKWNTGIC